MMSTRPHWIREELRRRSSATLDSQESACVSKNSRPAVFCDSDDDPNDYHKSLKYADNIHTLDEVALVVLLKDCTKQKDLCLGSKLHAIILRRGLIDINIIVGNSLVNIYAKCHAVKTAWKVLYELPIRDVVSWTSIIAQFCEQAQYEEALECFDRMLFEGLYPDQTSLASILKACGNTRDVKRGEYVHAEIVKAGWLEDDCVLGSALLDMYAKCGVLAKAQQIFTDLPSQDLITWNSLISGYAQWGYCDKATYCFHQSLLEGLTPDFRTFTCLLKVCANKGALEEGKRLHAEIAVKKLLGKDVALGSALVDMYVKCGAFALAKQCFDELPSRNEVSWTSLIMGFCQQMNGEEALACFEQMKQNGHFPDRVTFSCILKACGIVCAAETGKEIHGEILRLGLLGKDIVLGNALVDMYGKCGAVFLAQEVFDHLPAPNLVSWNALIAGYSQHGHGEEALSRFELLKCAGLSPDTVSYSCILKACGSIRAIKEGIEIHAEIARKELLGQGAVLGNSLVDMYAKCGALEMADQVFGGLCVRDLVSWNTLIMAHCEHGFSELGLELFEWMKGEGLNPDAVTYASILKACGNIEAAAWGEKIHNQIIKKGLLDTVDTLGNTLVAMYGKCGVHEKAESVFEQLRSPDVVSWNALIAGCCKFRHCQEALRLFELMKCHSINPDMVTFDCILKACNLIGATEKRNEFYIDMIVKGLIGDSFAIIGSAMLNMYDKCSVRARTVHVFDQFPTEDLSPCNASIVAKEVWGWFLQLKEEGLSPDIGISVLILRVLGNMEQLKGTNVV